IPNASDFKLPHLLSSSWLTPSSKPPSNLRANLAHLPTFQPNRSSEDFKSCLHEQTFTDLPGCALSPPSDDFLLLHSLVYFQSQVRYLKLSVRGK
ncbi:hypothetical protein CHARACLAT_028132, partial [Characodon lateralis]|nr:hypothetical protein [Characodon lateralis]